MNRTVRDLIRMCHRLAADSRRVVGGGGNASIKAGGRMYIKASGTAMSTLGEADVVAVRLDAVRAVMQRTDWPDDRDAREEAVAAAMLGTRADPAPGGPRPSVETVLHACMPFTYVLHVHPVDVNVLASSREGRRLAAPILAARGVHGVWIDYCDPGLTLGIRINAAVERAEQPPNVMILANHGLLVGADSAEAVGRLAGRIERLCAKAAGVRKVRVRKPTARQQALARVVAPAIRGACEGPTVVLYDARPALLALTADPEGKRLATAGPLSPDQIVYAGVVPAWVDGGMETASPEQLAERVRRAVARYRRRHGLDPRIVLVSGLGAFAIHRTPVQARAARDVYWSMAETLLAMKPLGGPKALTRRQTRFIDSWGAEKYRRALLERRGSADRAAGQVVLVTGAGQGVGAGIARGLADQGALLVCADLNADAVERVAASIREAHGPDAAVAVAANCADADQMAAAVRVAVDAYGGLDVLVSNAGILIARKVTEFDPDTWRKVIDVNLCGYFVSAQAAARVMAVQRRGHIIQINSKSGKEGSRYNSAYAASKFGGIGLTQSLALDLAEDGIRVNCICPGNFFDLPLWQAPGGLLDQYRAKFGGIPREAVLEKYLEKIPLGRGARVDDVVRTILYILDQPYETGQAYNVTGGQEMR